MDTETISAFRFRLYWLFSCLCLTRRGWLCDFPPKQPRVAFRLPYLVIELFTLVCLWCGRTVARSVYGLVITKFSGMDRFSYPWCSAARASRARALLSLKLISKSFRLRFLVMFATRSQLLGASATCAVRLRQPIPVKNYLQNRPSRENNVFPRTSTYCLSAFSFYVLSVPIFTTEESWLPVIKKLTLGRTRGWGGGGAWCGWMPPP